MKKYKYIGFDVRAQRIQGIIDAENLADAQTILRTKQIRALRIVPKREAMSFDFLSGSGKPDLVQFMAFIRQLSAMQGAGIPIVQALGVLADQVENKAFGKVLADVQKRIEQGTNLTDALKKHPKIFDAIFINLVSAGEMSGSLDKVLGRLAIYYEKAAALRRKIVSAMTYPALIVVLVIGLVIVLMMFVVPTFSQMFTSSGNALPGPTQMVLDISNGFRKYWYLIFGGLFGTAYGVFFLFTNPDTRKKIDPYLLELPIFGDLIRKAAIARFSRTLGTMIQAGVPILDGLEITAKIAGNYAIEQTIQKIRASITQGNSIAAPLLKTKVFPKMAVSMIAIGEQVGSLDQMLTKVAEFYEDEVDNKVGAITSLLEPLMIVVVGIVVASILIPMYLPIFKMADTIK